MQAVGGSTPPAVTGEKKRIAMTMRHTSYIAFLLALAGAVSCGKPSPYVLSADEIRVRVGGVQGPDDAGPGTKSIAETVVPETYELCLSARLVDGQNTKNNLNYLEGVVFRHRGDGLWAADPKVYHPLTGHLEYFCLATEPEGVDLQGTALWGEDVSRSVQVDIPDGESLTTEVLFGRSSSLQTGRGPLSLVLHHSQSLHRFNLTSSEAAGLVRIEKIIFSDVYTGGTLTVRHEGFLTANWAFRGHSRGDLIVPGSELVVLDGDGEVIDLLLPEQASRTIEIHYRRRDALTDSWDDASVVDVLSITPKEDTWWYGNMHIYNVNFKLTQIELSVSVEPWGSEDKYVNM